MAWCTSQVRHLRFEARSREVGPVKLDAVLIGVAEIKRFTDAVIRGSIELNIVLDECLQCTAQIGGVWDKESRDGKAPSFPVLEAVH